MKVFPRNPERRALWLQNVGRENWVPTDNSYLCEVHFSPEMWERRADHKRKLKSNAVPTIFGFFMKEKIINNISEPSTSATEPSTSAAAPNKSAAEPSTSAAYVSSTVEPDKQKEDNETMVNAKNKDYQ
ncbi:thap domain-containing protein, partial [Lasius niger]